MYKVCTRVYTTSKIVIYREDGKIAKIKTLLTNIVLGDRLRT